VRVHLRTILGLVAEEVLAKGAMEVIGNLGVVVYLRFWIRVDISLRVLGGLRMIPLVLTDIIKAGERRKVSVHYFINKWHEVSLTMKCLV
jgi:hypothetical protein